MSIKKTRCCWYGSGSVYPLRLWRDDDGYQKNAIWM